MVIKLHGSPRSQMVHVFKILLVESRGSHIQLHFEKFEEVVRMHHNVPVDDGEDTILESSRHGLAISAIRNRTEILHNDVQHLLRIYLL